MSRRVTPTSLALLAMSVLALMLAACASPGNIHSEPPLPQTPTATILPGNRYVDAKLGFSLILPPGWTASPQPGLRATPHTSAVTLLSPNEQATHQQVVIGVFESSAMPAAFALRGTPTMQIGPYLAIADDRLHGVARAPCLVRLFLARNDYVMATWCAGDAAAHASDFAQLLSTYLPAAPGFVSRAQPAPTPQSCAEREAALGYAATTEWGRTLAAPTATAPAIGWGNEQPGIYVCSNEGSPDLYLFQCTELVNQFLYAEWALPHIPGNAARYFDYYQNGQLHPGVIRDYPAGTYQLSSDASQGKSAFPPQPGDLLIFQDVNDPRAGWTSGLTTSPGHIALIVGVDATHVYVAQENYNETQYFLALPLATVTNGWQITDLSGLPNRIVRGWIRLTPNALP